MAGLHNSERQATLIYGHVSDPFRECRKRTRLPQLVVLYNAAVADISATQLHVSPVRDHSANTYAITMGSLRYYIHPTCTAQYFTLRLFDLRTVCP